MLDNVIQVTAGGQVGIHVKRAGDVPVHALRFSVADSRLGLPSEFLTQWKNDAGLYTVTPAGQRVATIALARRQLEALGGRLEFRNRTEGGCEAAIVIAITAARTLAGSNDRESAAAMGILQPLRVLVAENSEDCLTLLKAFLTGHRLEHAWNGPDAVRLAQTFRFDLILMDVQMPLMDGFAAAHQIRLWETTNGRPHVPIVILSADQFDTEVPKGAVAGCSGYLEKPFSRERLLRVVSTFAPAA
jgi:CheY-like chemotaxis protein